MVTLEITDSQPSSVTELKGGTSQSRDIIWCRGGNRTRTPFRTVDLSPPRLRFRHQGLTTLNWNLLLLRYAAAITQLPQKDSVQERKKVEQPAVQAHVQWSIVSVKQDPKLEGQGLHWPGPIRARAGSSVERQVTASRR